MTFTQAEEYIKGIDPNRNSIIVHPNVDWDLRQPKVKL